MSSSSAPTSVQGGATPQLVGFANFKRTNPKSDRFEVLGLDHLEMYCSDAQTASGRFMLGLDMDCVGKFESEAHACSVLVQSGGVRFLFTAPAGNAPDGETANAPAPIGFERSGAQKFIEDHGMAIRAIGLHVADCEAAYAACVANGGAGVLEPVQLASEDGGTVLASEVELYGDVVLRLISATTASGEAVPFSPTCPSLVPGYASTLESPPPGEASVSPELAPLVRFDHIVGNVPVLTEAWGRISRMTGFHQFAEFTAEDVGTVDSGLNSIVLASNSEMVLLPMNEPTFGTRRKSQIQSYLEINRGAGVQHIALLTRDIFATVREMRRRSARGGFTFMPRPSEEYYRTLPERLALGDDDDAPKLNSAQLAEAEELGILVDRDDQGMLLQIFTAPVGDRKTLFLEFIQRIGCDDDGTAEQRGGCGGFGKGNFAELFKTVEDFFGDED